MTNLYYLGNARHDSQRERMRELEASEICFFCAEGLAGRSVLLETKDWIVATNDYPYRGTKSHVVASPKRHVDDMASLTGSELADLAAVLAWHRSTYHPSGYGFAARNGDPALTGGTIRHLHFHLAEGDPDVADTTPIRMRLSSKPIISPPTA